MIRVLVIAAYASVRAGLQSLLAGADDCAIIGEGRGSADLEHLLPDAKPDVVLVDDAPDDRHSLLTLLSGGDAGLALLGEDRSGWLELAAGNLSGWAYLLKDADGAEIAGAIRGVSAGLIVLDRILNLSLISPPETSGIKTALPLLPGETLTAREHAVLQLMALGLPNKQIATRLSISLHTAKFHVASVLSKLGASSRTEAVTLGARRGDVLL